jgi:hypothetical protein
MEEEAYKALPVSEARRKFDRPDEYQPTPAKVAKPAKAPVPLPPPAPAPAPVPVKTMPFRPRERSPRLLDAIFLHVARLDKPAPVMNLILLFESLYKFLVFIRSIGICRRL